MSSLKVYVTPQRVKATYVSTQYAVDCTGFSFLSSVDHRSSKTSVLDNLVGFASVQLCVAFDCDALSKSQTSLTMSLLDDSLFDVVGTIVALVLTPCGAINAVLVDMLAF